MGDANGPIRLLSERIALSAVQLVRVKETDPVTAVGYAVADHDVHFAG